MTTVLFVYLFVGYTLDIEGLLPAVHSVITPGVLLAVGGEPYGMWEIELGSATCKASALPAVPSVWPYHDYNFFFLIPNLPQ